VTRRPFGILALASLAFVLAACDGSPTELGPLSAARLRATTGSEKLNATLVSLVGRRVFNDPDLSLRRNQSCAACHDPVWGFSSPDATINAAGAVMFGSVPERFGNRKPQSAAYATQSPVMHFDADDDTYVGGNFWDGRATGARLGSPAAEQAQAPFLNPVEQGLPDAACVVYRILRSSYAGVYMAAWGNAIRTIDFPENTDQLCAQEKVTVPLRPQDRAKVLVEYDRVARSVAAFEDSPDVNQFSSKYDAYLAGRATLTAEERKGLELFENKAGCAGCHPNDGQRALFTDYTYDNIGVPPNPLNPSLVLDARYRDDGLGDFVRDAKRNGAQKVPTLRNVDRRGVPGGAKSYMHNGVFKSLEDVVHFHNTRDVLPDCKAVPSPSFGKNCWPAPEVRENVNVDELGDLGLTPDEERAVVAYLKTLTDGYFVPSRSTK
jgi:cytochrome c peroxidase